jgi:hypothetical protein
LEAKLFPQPEYEFDKALTEILGALAPELRSKWEFIPRRDAFMLDLIGNTVCADLLDYAQRDAKFANLKMGYDASRIAENFTLVVWDACTYSGAGSKDRREVHSSDPFKGKCIRTAISLFSHKLRTDVPSELMNLLNVRFYLYERVLYHPTKCAAGAMLGVSLQLFGLHSLSPGSAAGGGLPNVVRYLGDSVFLDRAYQGGRLALEAVQRCSETTSIDEWVEMATELLRSPIDCPELEMARTIVERWRGSSIQQAIESMQAGIELLTRLMARRYYKQIFRNLPNAHNRFVDKKSEDLATHFLDASTRFRVERAIEERARLKRGTVVIHCPRINTAQKIANVLLVLPEGDGSHGEVRKLRDVGELDRDVFGSHQDAIKAVEDMYRSMWRLSVCAAPEYLNRWEEISDIAGEVIFQEFDAAREYPDNKWENDRHLVRELKQKYGTQVSRESVVLVRVTEVDQLVAAGLLDSDTADEQVRKAIRPEAVLRVLLPAIGRDRLEKKEERLFNDFVEANVQPMESDQFVSWVGSIKSQFLPEQPTLPLGTERHFKIGDFVSILERLKETLGPSAGDRKSGE